jgi:hypothetical protein
VETLDELADPLLEKNIDNPRLVFILPHWGQAIGASASFIDRRASNPDPQLLQLYSYIAIKDSR